MSQKNICVPFSSKYEYMSSFHFADVVKDVRVSCNSEDITLTISTYLDQFNGLVYPKGLSKNSTCMTEYIQEGSTITYVLTLRSCNTMSTDVVSYYSTSVVKKSSHLLNVESELFFCPSTVREQRRESGMSPIKLGWLFYSVLYIPERRGRILQHDRGAAASQAGDESGARLPHPLQIQDRVQDAQVRLRRQVSFAINCWLS